MSDITLGDVQGLMDSHEARTALRHSELIERFDKLDTRVRHLEQEMAERRPVFRGITQATLLLVGALITGFVGSHFGGS